MATHSIRPTLSFKVETNFDEDGIDLDELLSPDNLKLAAESGLALLKRRITLHQRRADGTAVTPYSTEPISIRTKGVGTGARLVKPRGGKLSKGGRRTKSGGTSKPGAFMHFPGGYREFRAKAGRGTVKDFLLSGNTLGKRFSVLRVSRNKVIVGWPAGSTQAIAAAGLHAQEKGKLFLWSDNEQEAITRTALFFIADHIARQGWVEDPPALNITDLEG